MSTLIPKVEHVFQVKHLNFRELQIIYPDTPLSDHAHQLSGNHDLGYSRLFDYSELDVNKNVHGGFVEIPDEGLTINEFKFLLKKFNSENNRNVRIGMPLEMLSFWIMNTDHCPSHKIFWALGKMHNGYALHWSPGRRKADSEFDLKVCPARIIAGHFVFVTEEIK